jgi:hypothetical protein
MMGLTAVTATSASSTVFGIRRTNPELWPTSDWFNAPALEEEPERGGILELNRYQAR